MDAARVAQVAGDQEGRFFEGIDDFGRPLRDPADKITEAFHWGRTTSGSVASALWFLLAPFGIVNAAGFMLPVAPHRPTPASGTRYLPASVARAALRFLGLGLTVTLTLAVALVFLDLWVWQSPGGPTRLTSFLAVLAGGVVPAGCFVLSAYRGTRPTEMMPTTAPATTCSGFTRPGFLDGDPEAPVLRALHLAGGLLAVAAVGGALGPQTGLMAVVRIAAVVLLIAVVTRVVFLRDRPWPLDRARTVSRLVAVGGGMPLVFVLVLVLVGPIPSATRLQLPGADAACLVSTLWCVVGWVVLSAGNVVLSVRARVPRGRRPDGWDRFRPFAGGMAASLITGVAIFVTVGFCGAVATSVGALLSTGAHTPQPPDMLSRAVYAWGITTIVAGLGGALVVGAMLASAPWRRRADAEAPFLRHGVSLSRAWTSRIARAIEIARLKNHLVLALGVAVALGAVTTVFALWEGLHAVIGAVPPPPGAFSVLSHASTESAGPTDRLTDPVQVIGTGLLALVATRLVFLARAAARDTTTRRGVNVVWDVIAFWPRSAHPFVPPPYAQGTEIRLTERLRWHLEDGLPAPHGHVVLCGHSQGSLISFATLVRLSVSHNALLQRIGLVTFGSQLQLLFARAFPEYVNKEALEHLRAQLGQRWINLYRDTDHLAGPVLSWDHRGCPPRSLGGPGSIEDPVGGRIEFGPDWRLVDPPLPSPRFQEEPLLPLRKHSAYWSDAAWPEAVEAVRPDVPAVSGVPPAEAAG